MTGILNNDNDAVNGPPFLHPEIAHDDDYNVLSWGEEARAMTLDGAGAANSRRCSTAKFHELN